MTRTLPFSAAAVAGLFSLTLCTSQATAAFIFWTGGSSGTFQNAGNWDQSIPGSNDTAVFAEAFAGSDDITVTFNDTVSNQGLAVTSMTLTLELDGFNYDLSEALTMITADVFINNGTLTAATAAIDLGSVLHIADDATVDITTATLGGTAGSTGQIDVQGTFNSAGSIILGNIGTGELNIGHDGTDSTGTGGEVNAATVLLGTGDNGQGTINIGENATLNSENVTLGIGSNSTATINVGDGGTWINSSAITIGAGNGTGEININDGGLLHTQNISIGANGTVTSGGTGAIVIAPTDIDLGDLHQSFQNRIDNGGVHVGSGGLVLASGGVLETTSAFIDSFSSSGDADATISGGGSFMDLDGGDLVVGGRHNGSMFLTNGGRVDSGDAMFGDRNNANAQVNITGDDGNGNASQLNVDGELIVGNSGSADLSILLGGNVTTTGNVHIGAEEGGTGNVTVTGRTASGPSTLDVGGELLIGIDLGNGQAASPSSMNAMLMVTNGGIVIIDDGAGMLTVNETGLLTGNATIDGNVSLFGRIAPGTSTGSLTITGDFQTHAGSVVQVQYNNEPLDVASVFPNLDPSLAEDLLTSGFVAVEGQATMADGTSVSIVKLTGNVSPGDAIIILHAEQGGLDASAPPQLEIDQSFLVNWVSDVLTDNGEDYLRLTAHINEPALDEFREGLTGNNRRVADALADGGLFNVLTSLDPDDPEAGLRGLLPLHHSAAAFQNLRTSRFFNDAFLQEMAGLRAGMRGYDSRDGRLERMFSSGTTNADTIARTVRAIDNVGEPVALGVLNDEFVGRWGGYLGGLGSWETVDSGDQRLGHRVHVFGVHGGVHYHLSRDLLFGLAGGYMWSELDFRRGYGEGDIDTIRGGPYLSWTPGGGDFFLNAGASYGYHRNDMDRETVMGTANSRYDAHDFSVHAQAGYDFAVHERTVLTPLLGAAYTHLRTDSFRERGAGNANLRVDSMTTDSLQVRVGARAAHAMDVGELVLIPEVSASFAYELLDDDRDMQSSFVAGSPAFTTRANGVGRESLQFTAGFSAVAGTYITLYVRYEGEFQSDRTSHGVIGGLDFRF